MKGAGGCCRGGVTATVIVQPGLGFNLAPVAGILAAAAIRANVPIRTTYRAT
jgi:hypothetical protein